MVMQKFLKREMKKCHHRQCMIFWFFFLHFQRILSVENVYLDVDSGIHHGSFVLLDYRYPETYSIASCFPREKNRSLFVIDAYRYLLNGLCLLKEGDVHMNITEHSILCPSSSYEKRFIFSQNGYCNPCSLGTMRETVYHCIEIHLLSFLKERNLSSLSWLNLEEVWDIWVSLSPFGNIFSEVLKEQWKHDWMFQMQRYINRPLQTIVDGLYLSSGTWNVYSLQIVFLILMAPFCEKDVFLFSFSQWLVSQMVPFERKLPNAALEALDHFIDEYKSIS